jgi:glycerophosphoryl diester phosphodiesterase
VRKSLIDEIKAAGRKILVWTVNATVDMKRFSKWGVDGIISDQPSRLARVLGRRPDKT